jgi:hypothetical protein
LKFHTTAFLNYGLWFEEGLPGIQKLKALRSIQSHQDLKELRHFSPPKTSKTANMHIAHHPPKVGLYFKPPAGGLGFPLARG